MWKGWCSEACAEDNETFWQVFAYNLMMKNNTRKTTNHDSSHYFRTPGSSCKGARMFMFFVEIKNFVKIVREEK